MKIKLTRAFLATILCLIVFLATTFIPSVRNISISNFLQGFSAGMGAGTLIATIHYYLELKKYRESKQS